MKTKITSSLLGLALGLGILMAGNQVALSEVAATGVEKGMWVWSKNAIAVKQQRDELLSFSKKKGITRLLVCVPIKADAAGSESFGDFTQPFQEFLKEASEANIKVEALAGYPEQAYEVNRAKTLRQLDFLIQFNKNQPAGAKLAGIHYDIEPYLSNLWKSGKLQQATTEVLETLSQMKDHIHAADSNLSLAFDISAFYDTNPDLMVTFHGEAKNFQEHIQDLTDYVAVMSYRRQADQVNKLCVQKIQYAVKTGKKVFASLETGEVKETPHITFFGSTPQDLDAVIASIVETNRPSPAFAGVMLHHYKSVRGLYGE